MDDDTAALTGAEVLLLIEALDALIPFKEEYAHHRTAAERERWLPHSMLRARLKKGLHMSFYDTASGWLEAELARERISLSDKLFTRLCELIEAPGASRRSVREGYAAAMRELREVRQSTPRPLS
jgi:hypothetical protein